MPAGDVRGETDNQGSVKPERSTDELFTFPGIMVNRKRHREPRWNRFQPVGTRQFKREGPTDSKWR